MTNSETCHKYDENKVIMCKAKGLNASEKWEDVNCPQCLSLRRTTIKLIPHDGGPCPVDGDYIVKTSNVDTEETEETIWYDCHKGDRIGWTWKRKALWHGNRIIAYCPIEIEEVE